MLIPQRKKTPDRLFDTYTFEQKSQVVKGFLFDGKSHCQLDTEILGLDGDQTRGWRSGNLLRHLGLTKDYKNLFEEYSVEEAIYLLESDASDDFSDIIAFLKNTL